MIIGLAGLDEAFAPEKEEIWLRIMIGLNSRKTTKANAEWDALVHRIPDGWS